MAALKSATDHSSSPSDAKRPRLDEPPMAEALARGRDGYSRLGLVRTKPGRADSPPTTTLSCSDKLAAYALLGIQGALLSNVFEPIYIDELVVGDVLGFMEGGAIEEEVVRREMERALRERGEVAWSAVGGLSKRFALFQKVRLMDRFSSWVPSRKCWEGLYVSSSSDPVDIHPFSILQIPPFSNFFNSTYHHYLVV